ncbi:MAG: hypothetical protein ACLFTT_13305 [Candidatus Hydrogenedentota bacterium]
MGTKTFLFASAGTLRPAATGMPRQEQHASVAGVLLALAAATVLVYFITREMLRRRRLRRAYTAAKEALTSGDADRAVAILRGARTYEQNARRLRPLLDLEVKARLQLEDVGGLAALYKDYTRPFEKNEAAALALGHAQIGLGEITSYSNMRDTWHGREHARRRWLALDVDALRCEGRIADARELLERAGPGIEDDPNLLARKGLLNLPEAPAAAQGFFQLAHRKRPDDAEIWRLHGEACARAGAIEEALTAYQRAVALAPKDPFARDILADTFRRDNQPAKAMAVWCAGLKPPSTPLLWLRVLFWGRVLVPAKTDPAAHEEPEGSAMPLVRYLMNLPPHRFWDAAAFEPVARLHPALAEYQEVFWLRLIEALRLREEETAFSLLNLGGFGAASWEPALELALRRVLVCRRLGFMPNEPGTPAAKQAAHPFFAALDARATGRPVPDANAFEALLQSRHIFAAALLAAGWHRAGLHIRSRQPLEKLPAWYVHALNEARELCAAT